LLWYLRFMENLKIKDFKIISQIDRFKSLRAFSRHLNIEPQNLSKKLEQIESSLGLKIVVRSAKGITLTSAGQQAVDIIKSSLQNLNRLESNLDLLEDYNNTINISSRGFIVEFLSRSLVKSFSTTQTSLRFIDQSPEALEKSARANLLDLCYHFGDVDLGKNWHKVKVGQIPYVYIVNKNHPLNGNVNINALKKYKRAGSCYIENDKFVVADLPKINNHSFSRGYDSENSIYTKAIVYESYQFAQVPYVSVMNEIQVGDLKILNLIGTKNTSKTVYLEVHQDNVLNSTQKKLVSESKIAFESLSLKFKKIMETFSAS